MKKRKQRVSEASVALRVPSALKRALRVLAQEDGRSVGNYVRRVLAAHVARRERP